MRNKIIRSAKKILFEDTWNMYGSQYMEQNDGEDEDTPVEPTSLMPNRLAIEKPPIEDSEYMPTNSIELSSAMAALGERVPHEHVPAFYRSALSNYESLEGSKLEDEMESKDLETPTDEATGETEEPGEGVYMENLEKRLRKIVKEMITEISDWSEFKLGNHYEDDEEEEEEDLESHSTKGEIKGKYVAPYYGKAGPSGVTLGTQRLLQNFLQHMYEVDEEDITDASDYIAYHVREQVPDFSDQKSFQVIRSGIFKKAIKRMLKAGQDIRSGFLREVVNLVKRLKPRDILKMVDDAKSETESEAEAFADLASYLEQEDPEQYEVLQDLFNL